MKAQLPSELFDNIIECRRKIYLSFVHNQFIKARESKRDMIQEQISFLWIHIHEEETTDNFRLRKWHYNQYYLRRQASLNS